MYIDRLDDDQSAGCNKTRVDQEEAGAKQLVQETNGVQTDHQNQHQSSSIFKRQETSIIDKKPSLFQTRLISSSSQVPILLESVP
jgi:hypothetical protein